MGGKGSGGFRSGAGRKARSARVVAIHGGKVHGIVRPVESAPVQQPASLSAEVQAVWAELALPAVNAGTLVANTSSAFVRLCHNVVKHAQMEAQIAHDGLTYLKVSIDGAGTEHTEVKAHPLISRAQALDNAIRASFKDFGINPFGKPLADAIPKPVDPFAEFDNEVAQ